MQGEGEGRGDDTANDGQMDVDEDLVGLQASGGSGGVSEEAAPRGSKGLMEIVLGDPPNARHRSPSPQPLVLSEPIRRLEPDPSPVSRPQLLDEQPSLVPSHAHPDAFTRSPRPRSPMPSPARRTTTPPADSERYAHPPPRSPTPSPPHHSPTPPPPPKVKLTLQDFKLRKQKRKEEEELAKAVKSPEMATMGLGPDAETSPTDSGFHQEAEANGVKPSAGAMEEGEVDSRAKTSDSQHGGRVDVEMKLETKVLSDEPANGIPSFVLSTPPLNGGAASLKAKIELVEEDHLSHSEPAAEEDDNLTREQSEQPTLDSPTEPEPSHHEGTNGHTSSASVSGDPSPPSSPRLGGKSDASSSRLSTTSSSYSQTAGPEDGEITSSAPSASFLLRSHSPPTQPRSFSGGTGSSIAPASSSQRAARLSPTLSRPLPSGPRALRGMGGSSVVSSATPAAYPPSRSFGSSSQYIPRGPSADRDRKDRERERGWVSVARGRGRGSSNGWSR